MPINKDTPMGDVIKDFQGSDAPQFQGKSKEKKRQMAIAAKLNAEDFEGLTVEEQLDLISYMPLAMQEEAKKLLGLEEKRGLWDNIHAKRKRIKAGSGERMRKPGSEGAPSDKDLRDSQKEEVETVDEKKGPCWTGYKKVPGKKDYEDGSCVKEEKCSCCGDDPCSCPDDCDCKKQNEQVELTEQSKRLELLLKLGLVNRTQLIQVRRALNLYYSGATLTPTYRDILFDLLDRFISIVDTDDIIFNQMRRKVQESGVMDEIENVLVEAGYCDPPKNMKEFRKKFPNLDKKIKSTDSNDFNTAVTPSKISECYVNHLSFISKK